MKCPLCNANCFSDDNVVQCRQKIDTNSGFKHYHYDYNFDLDFGHRFHSYNFWIELSKSGELSVYYDPKGERLISEANQTIDDVVKLFRRLEKVSVFL